MVVTPCWVGVGGGGGVMVSTFTLEQGVSLACTQGHSPLTVNESEGTSYMMDRYKSGHLSPHSAMKQLPCDLTSLPPSPPSPLTHLSPTVHVCD